MTGTPNQQVSVYSAPQAQAMHHPHSALVVQFLVEVGLSVELRPGASGFTNHIEIEDGALHIDPHAHSADLLHEAGHLAIVPKRYRHYLGTNISKGIKHILSLPEVEALCADDPTLCALLSTGDPEATAWCWAAGVHLGLPPEAIILDENYEGDGADIRSFLAAGAYAGINGLAYGGFCVTRPNPYRPLPAYPRLSHWLQP